MKSARPVSAVRDGVVLIGVDGGASGLRAARVSHCDDGLFELAGEPHCAACEPAAGAQPWIEAAARLVALVSASAPVLLGIGMPGIKTADGRGIASANHGPVEPRFLELLEARLAELGVHLVAPTALLDDDGLLGCAGERHGRGGALIDVTGNAYYLGGGTGLAEALVVDGAAVALESAPRPLERAYRLEHAGRTFEELLSAGGLNRAYVARGGNFERIEQGLAQDEAIACELVALLRRTLDALVDLRERALDLRFERVVVGQRLAQILSTKGAHDPFERASTKTSPVVLSSQLTSAVIGAAALASERHRKLRVG